MEVLLNIFLLSLVAGLGTGLGGLIAVIRKPGPRLYGFLMGITAGVMITLSFLELVNEAWQLQGFVTATIGFGIGAIFMFLLDVTIPHVRFGEEEVPHQDEAASQQMPVPLQPGRLMFGDEFHLIKSNIHRRFFNHQAGRRRFGRLRHASTVDFKLMKSGILIAIGITIHNIPEGIAVGAGYMHTPQFGLFIALAILLHNIPEGIATALPLCTSGICRWDSFRVAFLSGMAEPVGAVFAALFLSTFHALIPGALAFAGGVMVFITLDELIPAAREHGHHHFTALGIIAGALFVFLLSGFLGI